MSLLTLSEVMFERDHVLPLPLNETFCEKEVLLQLVSPRTWLRTCRHHEFSCERVQMAHSLETFLDCVQSMKTKVTIGGKLTSGSLGKCCLQHAQLKVYVLEKIRLITRNALNAKEAKGTAKRWQEGRKKGRFAYDGARNVGNTSHAKNNSKLRVSPE